MTAPFNHLLFAFDEPTRPDDGVVGALMARRAQARAELVSCELPTTDEEAWRYSPINDLDLSAFREASPPADGRIRPLGIRWSNEPATQVHLVDGVVVLSALGPEARSAGVMLIDFVTDDGLYAGAQDAGWPGDLAERLVSEPLADAFARYAAGASAMPMLVVIPPGAVLSTPILVNNDSAESGGAVPSHVMVLAGANSEATIIEWHGGAATDSLAVPLVEVVLDTAARLKLLQVQDQPRSVTQLGNLRAIVGRDATFELFHAGLGGSYVRQRTDCRLAGRGATGNLDALFYGDGGQTLDFRTYQIHEAANTTSNLLFTGAVGGHARSVYTGLIRIEKEARGSNAFQTNRNLKLSDNAWADSVPNLEIENNDVKCSHASTVSPVDADQQFYLESRGVPTAMAERLVVEGFFREVLSHFPATDVAAWIDQSIATRLDTSDQRP